MFHAIVLYKRVWVWGIDLRSTPPHQKSISSQHIINIFIALPYYYYYWRPQTHHAKEWIRCENLKHCHAACERRIRFLRHGIAYIQICYIYYCCRCSSISSIYIRFNFVFPAGLCRFKLFTAIIRSIVRWRKRIVATWKGTSSVRSTGKSTRKSHTILIFNSKSFRAETPD